MAERITAILRRKTTRICHNFFAKVTPSFSVMWYYCIPSGKRICAFPPKNPAQAEAVSSGCGKFLSISAALAKSEQTGKPAVAIQLPDGQIVTGKTSSLLGASAAGLLNALKALGGIGDKLHLISPVAIDPIQKLKTGYLGNRNPRLHTDEILIALSISAATNPTAELALEHLPCLRGCEVHSTVILSEVDERTFKRLGVRLTCEPQFK